MTTAALVVVPISRAFSDAPNRLLGFYETVIVVAGAYLAYKSFFNKKFTLETAIKKRKRHIRLQGNDSTSNSNWKQLPDDKKVEEFYDYVVELVTKYDPGPGRAGENQDGGDASDDRYDEHQPLLQ